MALPEEPLEPFERSRTFAPVQLSVRWPGVFAGTLIAMGVLVILASLGLAVGATTATNGSELGHAAAWWGGISFLIALFIGAAVAARWVAGALTSVLQGALVWVLSVVAVFYLAGAGISLGAQGLFAAMNSPAFNSAMQQMASNANQVASQVGTSGTMNAAQSAAPAAWITFIVLCVSALAAIIGALVGSRKDVRPLA